MRTAFRTALAIFLATPLTAAAATANIPFAGSVANSCVVTVLSDGELGVGASMRTLNSNIGGGRGGEATVLATGAGFTMSVEAPAAFDSAPAEDTAPTTFDARFRGTGATSFVTTDAPQSVNRGITNVRVHLIASKGFGETFAAGDYTATVVLRCE